MLEQIVEWLELKEGARILTAGKQALLTAAFIASTAKNNGIIIKVHAVTGYETEEQALKEAAKQKVLRQVKEGLVAISYETGKLENVKPLKKYDYAVVISEKPENLKTLNNLAEKALLVFPHDKGGMIETTEGLFKKKKTTSLKKLLEKSFKIIDYDLVGKHLFFKTKPKKFKEVNYRFLSCNEAAEFVVKEIQEVIRFAAGGSKFALISDNKEFIYYVNVEDVMNQPFEYSFIFPNGKCNKTVGKKRIRSKKFTIIVLPNVKSIIKELSEKEVVITTKERVLQLFGEQYVY